MTALDPPFNQQATDLDEDAMKGSDLLENLMREARANAPAPTAAPIRRGPGRPRGSRNATSTASSAGRVPPPPRQRSTAPLDPNAPTAEERKELREGRTAELQEKIAEGINETIMLGLTSVGVPVGLLYKPGQEPQLAQESEKYTDIAKGLIVSPNQARFWARFLAELEATEQGKKFSAATGSGNTPLFIYGALSVLTLAQYVQNASNTYKTLKPLVDQYHAGQAIMQQQAAEARQQAENNAQSTGG